LLERIGGIVQHLAQQKIGHCCPLVMGAAYRLSVLG
jgi:hypothetical protein